MRHSCGLPLWETLLLLVQSQDVGAEAVQAHHVQQSVHLFRQHLPRLARLLHDQYLPGVAGSDLAELKLLLQCCLRDSGHSVHIGSGCVLEQQLFTA